MKNVFYWCPHINYQVATCKAVLNSAYSLKKYSKTFHPVIINCFGEWDYFKKELEEKNIEVINLFNLKINLPINGFFRSRLFYITFSIFAILPLFNLIKSKKPDYLILHLIVIPGLILSMFSKHSTKFILRISGFPKLNLFRKTLWSLCSKNLSAIFSPTKNTIRLLKDNKIFRYKEIKLLEDPIIEIHKINKLKKENLINFKNNDYLVSVGRLTKQKNFDFLISAFDHITRDKNLMLLIIGSGELKNKLYKKIQKLNLIDKIILTDYQENIFKYLYNSKLFVLTSNWEDPGFVIIEAAICGKLIISSNVHSGPLEFIGKDENCGFIYKKNDFEDFSKKINFALKNLNQKSIKLKMYNAKKKANNYTLFRHSQKLLSHLSSLD